MTASDRFDAHAAFRLLKTIEGQTGSSMIDHLAAAIEAALAAFDAREAHSADVASYALKRVTVEIESRIGTGAA